MDIQRRASIYYFWGKVCSIQAIYECGARLPRRQRVTQTHFRTCVFARSRHKTWRWQWAKLLLRCSRKKREMRTNSPYLDQTGEWIWCGLRSVDVQCCPIRTRLIYKRQFCEESVSLVSSTAAYWMFWCVSICFWGLFCYIQNRKNII